MNPDLFFSIHAPHILHLWQTVFFKLCQSVERLVFWRARLSKKESVRSLIWQHPSSAAFHGLHLNIAPTTKVRVRNASVSTTIRSSLYDFKLTGMNEALNKVKVLTQFSSHRSKPGGITIILNLRWKKKFEPVETNWQSGPGWRSG